MVGKACERLGSKRGESRWCLEGDDGDHVSDNRSTEGTWPWTQSCVPCTSWAVKFPEASGEMRTGVS